MKPLAWCEQRLLVRGHPLTASLPFAPPEYRDRILALRAVIAEIAAVPDSVSDRDVGLAKLEWWRRALNEELPHPARQALAETGAAARADSRLFEALIDGIALTLDSPRFENRDQAWRYCLAAGGPAAGLEASIMGGDEALTEALQPLGAVALLVRLVRDLAMGARRHRWFVPLDLQAEYQVSRQDVADGRGGVGFDGLVRSWLADGFGRARSAVDVLTPAQAWQHRHLLIQHALDRRLAARLERRPGRLLTRRVLTGSIGNAWCAWRTARSLMRWRRLSQR